MAELGTLGRYRLIRRLAAGGMGEVYLAELPGVANFSQRVAIKRILPHLARDTDFVEKFIDEAYIMMRLHHGNIVGVHELADEAGELYIVMEYLPGRDLKAVTRRLRERRQVMPVDLALWLVGEICAALDYAHRKTDEDGAPMHIVHRDVSPSNVLLGAAGEVKLLDFGIARARGKLHQSVSGTLQGKFVYMSPEQADGRSVDARSDIYSAGLVLYELITGVRPFEGESETETLRKVRNGVVKPPCSLRSELPEALDALVMQALASQAEDRYPTAAAMRRAMQLHLADTRSHADAQQLSEWLAELFPEGVVSKHGPAGPMSIEDALEMQLGALTPNIDPMTRTHTADPGAVVSQPPAADTPTPSVRTLTPMPSAAITTGPQAPVVGHPSVPIAQITDQAFQAQPPPKGRKRTLALAVLLGALLASVGVMWWLNRTAATVEPTVIGPAPSEYVMRRGLDGPEILKGVELPVGEAIELCIVADGFESVCKSLQLADGRNEPQFTLRAVPQLSLKIVPGDVPVEFTIDGEPTAVGVHRIGEEPVKVCVTPDPPNWRLVAGQARCVTIRGELGKVRHVERAFEPIPDQGVPPRVADAGPPSAPDASPTTGPKVRPIARPRSRLHTVGVTTPGAELRCGERRYTTFPARIETTKDLNCTVTAPDHARQRFTLSGRHGSKREISLAAFGLISVRAEPGAGTLLVNGQRMKTTLLQSHRVPAGPVRLEIRFNEGGQLFSKKKTVKVLPGKALNTSICVSTPTYKCPRGA